MSADRTDDQADGNSPCMPDWAEALATSAGRRVCVAGIGNRERGDDGAGPIVAASLPSTGRLTTVDCGTAPESYLGSIVAGWPDVVVFVDAADLGAEPGTVRLVEEDDLGAFSASTHAAGLRTAAEFVRQACGAECLLLAVQPGDTSYGGGLSAQVAAAVEEIVAGPVWQRLAGG